MTHEEPRFLGLKIETWATIIGPVVAMSLLYAHMEHVFKATEYLLKFARNSDLYNSTKSGIPFEQGKPVNFAETPIPKDPGVYKP